MEEHITMLTEDQIKALKQTLLDFGLKENKIDEFIDAYFKRVAMNIAFDPDFDEDLEIK